MPGVVGLNPIPLLHEFGEVLIAIRPSEILEGEQVVDAFRGGDDVGTRCAAQAMIHDVDQLSPATCADVGAFNVVL